MRVVMKLDSYLAAHAITQQRFAELIGCEQPTVARFLKGRIPSPDLMVRITKATAGAVTPNDFFDVDQVAA